MSVPAERRLAIAARTDAAAREQVVEAFTPAISRLARRYHGYPTVARDELMQEGIVGLLRAIQRYDPERGTPFWAYGSWWVRQAMQNLVAELARPIVLSDRAARQLARVKDARRTHQQRHGREPSGAELAAVTRLPYEQIQGLIAADRVPRSLGEPVGGDTESGSTLGDLIADPRAEDDEQRMLRRVGVGEQRRVLSERERVILRARFGIGGREHTLQDIGGRVGLSAERVRQIEQRALGKLRAAAEGPAAGQATASATSA